MRTLEAGGPWISRSFDPKGGGQSHSSANSGFLWDERDGGDGRRSPLEAAFCVSPRITHVSRTRGEPAENPGNARETLNVVGCPSSGIKKDGALVPKGETAVFELVERAGFEPAYACAGRFTVCCL